MSPIPPPAHDLIAPEPARQRGRRILRGWLDRAAKKAPEAGSAVGPMTTPEQIRAHNAQAVAQAHDLLPGGRDARGEPVKLKLPPGAGLMLGYQLRRQGRGADLAPRPAPAAPDAQP